MKTRAKRRSVLLTIDTVWGVRSPLNNSVMKAKLLSLTPPPTQHHFFVFFETNSSILSILSIYC